MEDTKVLDKNEEKKPKTPKEITILVLKIVGNVIFYGVLILLFIISIANINAGGSKGLPKIFGKGFLSVQSESMDFSVSSVTSSVSDNEYTEAQKNFLMEQGVLASDGTYTLDYSKFKVGGFSDHDMVVVDMLNDDQKRHLSIGDVIAYYDENENKVITHRIVFIHVDADSNIVDYVTMGDYVVGNNDDVFSGTQWGIKYSDEWIFKQVKVLAVNSEYIYGRVTSVIGGAGDVADNVKANWLLYFVIPVALILLVEMFFVYKNFVAYRNEKKGVTKDGKIVATNSEIDLEAERERMKQELLAELRASGAVKEDTTTKEVKEDIQADNTEVEENGTDTEEESDTNNDLEEDSSNKDEE